MSKLSLAVPNGSLEKQVLGFLSQAGIQVNRPSRQFRIQVEHDLVREVIFMRPQDVPREVALGHYDAGICGFDYFEEYAAGFDRSQKPYGLRSNLAGRFTGPSAEVKPTKIVLIAHESDPAESKRDVPMQASILSEYPTMTRKMLSPSGLKHGLSDYDATTDAHGGVVPSFGCTEAHVPWNYRFGVCLVESGSTINANRLKIVDVLCETYPVLIENGSKREEQSKLTNLFKEAGLV